MVPVCCTEREYSHALNLAQRISVPNLARPESRSSNLGPESRTCESILHSQKVDLALRGNVAIEGFWCYYQRKNGRKDAWSLLLCRISLGLDLGRRISHALNLACRISVPNLARPSESRSVQQTGLGCSKHPENIIHRKIGCFYFEAMPKISSEVQQKHFFERS